jgi:serine/threonine-protein kinase
MATVYLAHDNKFDTNVAVKVLNKEFVNNENIRKRFISEARNMYKMSHPNIIKVTDLIEEGDTVAFVMEYIEGETLKEYLERKGKLSDAEIKDLFLQMLDAVGYVHEQNLVHRDIKPSNFILDKNGKIKLMDFGIAKNMDVTSSDYTHTGTNQNMGTPMYMSPEQIKSTKDVTLQSDIYSLGVVLWQMVMGKKPYDTNTTSTFELQMKIVQDELPSTNTFWDSIIKKATAKDIGKRYNNCIELRQILDNSSNKKGNIEKDHTILLNGDDRTVVEEKIKVKKTPTVRKKKNLTINAESSQKTIVNDTKNSSKYWHLLWILVPVLIRAIFISSDQDNQAVIPSVVIGEQEWMVTNLNVETFRNGDTIPEVKSNEEWKKAGEEKKPAWCYVENVIDSTGVSGRLYNWYAVNDVRGLAPKGWRIPDDKDWNKLINFLGGKEFAANKLKSTSGWLNTDDGKIGNGNNSSGFNSHPSGNRVLVEPYFFNDFETTLYWSSSELAEDEFANYLWLWNDGNIDILSGVKSNGIHVRCIKDK